MDDRTSESHLSDADLFALAVPAAGEPEALPRHLSECQACSRSLQEWKSSVRALGEESVDAINRRSPEQWHAAAEATMARIRRAARPGRARRPLRWALGVAASLLILALAVPRRAAAPSAVATAAPETSGLSEADREDDQLLRDVAFLAQGDDTASIMVTEESL
ncbi:MAG TPA: hypothetical protein VIB08_06160 [Thermoanaerobaculia bacterium]